MNAPDRRQSERRISPAVGEYAIQECARLRESHAQLLAALQHIARADVDYQHAAYIDDALLLTSADEARRKGLALCSRRHRQGRIMTRAGDLAVLWLCFFVALGAMLLNLGVFG